MTKKNLHIYCLALLVFIFSSCGGPSVSIQKGKQIFIYRSEQGTKDKSIGYKADDIIIDPENRAVTLRGNIVMADISGCNLYKVAFVDVDKDTILRLKFPTDAPYYIYLYYDGGETRYYYLPATDKN